MSQVRPSESLLVDFSSLVAWYRTHCDGDWEHTHGIRLETLDNPGWQLTVDLVRTNLQGRCMEDVVEGCNPDGHPVSLRWINCVVRENRFRGACDPTQLQRLFTAFERFSSLKDGSATPNNAMNRTREF